MSRVIGQVWREVVGCRNWPVMRVPQFIALRRNDSRKCIWKCRLQKWRPSCFVLNVPILQLAVPYKYGIKISSSLCMQMSLQMTVQGHYLAITILTTKLDFFKFPLVMKDTKYEMADEKSFLIMAVPVKLRGIWSATCYNSIDIIQQTMCLIWNDDNFYIL